MVVLTTCGYRAHETCLVGLRKWISIAFNLNWNSHIVVQSLSHVQLFATPWTAACQASLSSTVSRSLLKLMSIESVMPSNHLILCLSFRLSSIFPSIRVFSNELALHLGWPQYWSFSFRTDWFDLLAIWGTLKIVSSNTFQKHQFYPRDSRVFSGTTVLKHRPFSLFYGPALTSVHDYWKNHRFDYMDLCQQSDVSLF